MRRSGIKWAKVIALSGAFAIASATVATYASDRLYSEDNVSISAAIDKYIASGTDVFECTPNSQIGAATPCIKVKKAGDITITEHTDELAEAKEFFAGKAVVMADGYVNIRNNASADSQIIATILPQGIVSIDEKGQEWSLVSSGDCRGYIHNDYMMFGDAAASYAVKYMEKKAFVTASALTVRESKDAESTCLATLPNGCGYDVLEQSDEWTKIKVDDSIDGFVRSEYIEVTYNMIEANPVVVPEQTPDTADEQSSGDGGDTAQPTTEASDTTQAEVTTEASTQEQTTTEASAEDDSSDSGIGQKIADFAVQYVGNPYVYGGTSLTNGADCSGFAQSVMKNFGYTIPRTADDQSLAGTAVSRENIRPGDLVFYDYGTGVVQHVAIYIGGDQIVHAKNTASGIVISSAFYNTPIAIRRIAN